MTLCEPRALSRHIPVRVAPAQGAGRRPFRVGHGGHLPQGRAWRCPQEWDEWPADLPPALVKDMPTLEAGADMAETIASILNKALEETLYEVLGVQVVIEDPPPQVEAEPTGGKRRRPGAGRALGGPAQTRTVHRTVRR